MHLVGYLYEEKGPHIVMYDTIRTGRYVPAFWNSILHAFDYCEGGHI
jgi:hypothetical protein